MMKERIYALCFVLFFYSFCYAQESKNKEKTLKLMSYNIRHAAGMDNVVDVERISKVILKVAPEVVGLQEVDSVVARSGYIDTMQKLGEHTGMYSTYGYSILYSGGKYGNGILTKEKPKNVEKIELPGKDEARSALIVELSKYVIVTTHLSLDESETKESVPIINKAISRYNKPVFLMGDFNVEPNSATMAAFEVDWQILNNVNQYTFPSDMPEVTIDYILGYKKNTTNYLKILDTQVLNEPIASDHRPLFVNVLLRK